MTRMNEADLFPSRRMTVLLVDDQVAIIEAVRRMLSTEPDVDFHFCRNPIQAIKMANQIAPTVILQDLIMPEIDGLTLVRYFRANQATRDVPLIVLSVNEEATTKAEAFALGANDYMVKFPDRVEVIARLRYHSRGYINLLERNDAHECLKIAMTHEQQRVQEFAVLNEMSAKLQTCASEADTFPLIARAYQQLFPNSAGSVNLLDLGGETVRVAVAWGNAAREPRDFKKQACRALTQGHGHVTMPDGTGERCAHLPDALAQASCCIPMLAQGEPRGVIVLQCGEIQQMLVEAATAYSPSVSTFMFMDGMIPLGNDMLTDFSKLPKFGAHVTIETSAKGPIINIRHDRTVAPVDRCYRYGEELYAASRAEELKQFLALLQNRY